MPRFIVRTNCEYSLEVEAETPEKAMEKAQTQDIATWNQAWAPAEAEEQD